MAILASKQSGNFTSSATWGVINQNGATYLNSEANSTGSTTSYVGSSSFVLGIQRTIEGIYVKLARRDGSSGTVSVQLFNVTAGVAEAGSEVTINTVDLPSGVDASNAGGGWIFFRFASALILSTSDSYRVEIKSSAASNVTLFRDATAGNWSRALRTNATQAPVAGDDLIIAGQHTAAGTNAAYTVTMNETASTDYGSASTSLVTPAIAICHRGTLQYETTAATNYVLRVAGNLIVYAGGTLNIGTTGTPIPNDSTAVLEFDCASVGDFGVTLRVGATCNLQGMAKTYALFLAADAAAAATSGTLSGTPTGWKNGDNLVFASTTRTMSQSEEKALSADVSTTSFSFAALTNAHAGGGATNGSEVKAEVCNITRNIKIRSVSSSAYSYFTVLGSTTAIDWDYAEFRYMGGATLQKRGVEIGATGGSVDINGCVVKDSSAQTSAYGFYFSGTGLAYSITNCLSWNTGNNGLLTLETTALSTINNFIGIKTANSHAVYLRGGVRGTVTNITGVSAASNGVLVGEVAFVPTGTYYGTVNNILGHSNGAGGVVLAEESVQVGKAGALIGWRNTTQGVGFDSAFRAIRCQSVRAFGNLVAGIQPVNQGFAWVEIDTVSIDAGLVLTQPIGVYGLSGNAPASNLFINGGNIGQNQAHATADVSLYRTNFIWSFNSVTLHSTNKVVNQTSLPIPAQIKFQSIGSAPIHRTYRRQGTIAIETTTLHTGSQAMSMTPLIAAEKLESGPFFVAVANGATATPSVYIYKHASYNGNQPRLILRANPAIGINADVVIATYSASTGSWNAISGTTAAASADGVMEFYIDCDGTAGAIYVDTFTVT